MRIALLTTTFLPVTGGAEFTIHNLARCWSDSGHEVCVINTVSSRTMHSYGVRQYSLLRGAGYFSGLHRNPFKWHAVRKLRKMIRDFSPDFISAHMAYPVALWLADIQPSAPFIVTCHGADITDSFDGYRQRYSIDELLCHALNCSTGVVAVSSHSFRLLTELGVRAEKIAAVPNGVDVEMFRKKVEVDLRSRLMIPSGAVLILTVGRHSPAKDLETALRAFAKLSRAVNDVYYLIVGKGTESLYPLASELGIGKKVVFSGVLSGDDLVAAYQQSDIFFSSSRREFCPLVVLEAMAAGIPAVVTDVGGSQDLIRTGENGIVVEAGDPDSMSEALIQLAVNSGMRDGFGRRNIELSTTYRWEDISRRYLECF